MTTLLFSSSLSGIFVIWLVHHRRFSKGNYAIGKLDKFLTGSCFKRDVPASKMSRTSSTFLKRFPVVIALAWLASLRESHGVLLARRRIVCSSPIDVVLVLDASSSVGIRRWEGSMIPLVISLSEELNLRMAGTRMGIITFSNNAVPVLDLNDPSSGKKSRVKAIAQNIPYKTGNTGLASGLHAAYVMLKNSPRRKVVRRVILAIDGLPNVDDSGAVVSAGSAILAAQRHINKIYSLQDTAIYVLNIRAGWDHTPSKTLTAKQAAVRKDLMDSLVRSLTRCAILAKCSRNVDTDFNLLVSKMKNMANSLCTQAEEVSEITRRTTAAPVLPGEDDANEPSQHPISTESNVVTARPTSTEADTTQSTQTLPLPAVVKTVPAQDTQSPIGNIPKEDSGEGETNIPEDETEQKADGGNKIAIYTVAGAGALSIIGILGAGFTVGYLRRSKNRPEAMNLFEVEEEDGEQPLSTTAYIEQDVHNEAYDDDYLH